MPIELPIAEYGVAIAAVFTSYGIEVSCKSPALPTPAQFEICDKIKP